MRKPCAECGREYEAKRPRSMYCSDTCGKRSRRRGAPRADVIALPAAQPSAGSDPADEGGSVAAATRAELESAGRVDTALGAIALALAARIDQSSGDTGAALASLSRELRAALESALEGVESADDPLVAVRASALRVVAG